MNVKAFRTPWLCTGFCYTPASRNRSKSRTRGSGAKTTVSRHATSSRGVSRLEQTPLLLFGWAGNL